MRKTSFDKLFYFQRKSKIKAGDGLKLDEGEFPFFTSSNTLTKSIDQYLFDNDSLIFGTGGKASIHYCQDKFAVSTDCLVCQPKDNIDIFSKYVYYYLSGNIHILENGFKGAGLKHISKKYISDLKIPLPPLDQQKKIASILDTADTYRQKTKALIDKYDELTQSLFLDMFGDPVTNPKGWKFLTIGDILAVKSQNGHYAPKNEYIENGVEMVHMSDAFYHKVVPGSLKTVKVNEKLLSKYNLKPTDLLISRRSLTYEGSAKPCLIPEYANPLIYESSLIRLSPKLDIVNTLFLFYFFSEPRARQKYVFKYVTKSTISGINNKGLNSIKVFIPPVELQNQFAERVQAIEAQKTKAQASLEQADNLFNSLLQKAFKGELV